MEKLQQLKTIFPEIRDRETVLKEIRENRNLNMIYEEWKEEQKEEFLDYCCGNRGMRILYDSFFKEVMNVEYDSSRLEDFLSTVLKKRVKIVKVLPNESTRIAGEATLLVTDIVVELEDGSLANVEIQKVGYMFPGARCACYSSDLLLRQYKRVRDRLKEHFSYREIRDVYLIVIYESSPQELKAYPDNYYHMGKVTFETGLELNMLQNYVMISLDIFKKHMQNKDIDTHLEAWLTFLSEDRPEKIIKLISEYPQFKAMYQTLYDMCLNVERMMQMFSQELRELDRNTVKLMIEENQRLIDEQQELLERSRAKLKENEAILKENEAKLKENEAILKENEGKLKESEGKLKESEGKLKESEGKLKESEGKLKESEAMLKQRDAQILQLQQELALYRNTEHK